ncbi:MAG TPA: alpha-hydroxy acid oxidase [Gemmatimonadaceae bacterium]|nr:alpha-hydroxy acid oxidase [Gemmatimonadaceae bacterium]
MTTFVNLLELEALAKPRLPTAVFDYFAGGAHDEITLGANRRAYETIALRPRVLVDVSHRDLSTPLLGATLAFPILVAPMALQRMAHSDGELATARAVTSLKTLLTVSTLSSVTAEDIRAACALPPWFQIYVHQDRALTEAMLARVAACGYGALVLTVDTPVLGRRERDVRNTFQPPPGIAFANMMAGLGGGATTGSSDKDSALAMYFAARHDASVTWKDLAWLRRVCPLPLVLKGVMRGDDAKQALDHGVDAVIVSNHGGRQLDTAIATIRALPEVAEAAGSRMPVLVDGGVRRGTDVLKALALGARAVLVGRPVLWGLALEGEAGVARVLTTLRDELDIAMALCGCATVADIGRDLVAT